MPPRLTLNLPHLLAQAETVTRAVLRHRPSMIVWYQNRKHLTLIMSSTCTFVLTFARARRVCRAREITLNNTNSQTGAPQHDINKVFQSHHNVETNRNITLVTSLQPEYKSRSLFSNGSLQVADCLNVEA
jgi:hypothetical protein